MLAHTRAVGHAGMHIMIFCSCFGPTVVYRRTTAQGIYRTQIKRLKMRNTKSFHLSLVMPQLEGTLNPNNRTKMVWSRADRV